jgi:hypothetical protein
VPLAITKVFTTTPSALKQQAAVLVPTGPSASRARWAPIKTRLVKLIARSVLLAVLNRWKHKHKHLRARRVTLGNTSLLLPGASAYRVAMAFTKMKLLRLNASRARQGNMVMCIPQRRWQPAAQIVRPGASVRKQPPCLANNAKLVNSAPPSVRPHQTRANIATGGHTRLSRGSSNAKIAQRAIMERCKARAKEC